MQQHAGVAIDVGNLALDRCGCTITGIERESVEFLGQRGDSAGEDGIARRPDAILVDQVELHPLQMVELVVPRLVPGVLIRQRMKEMVGLGRMSFPSRKLSKESMDRAITTLARFQQAAQQRQCEKAHD